MRRSMAAHRIRIHGRQRGRAPLRSRVTPNRRDRRFERLAVQVQLATLTSRCPILLPAKGRLGNHGAAWYNYRAATLACPAPRHRVKENPMLIHLTSERFWNRVDKTGDCWIWTGPTNKEGYGTVSILRLAHRLAYEDHFGELKSDLDHLCRVRNCVNPAHLEPVTRGENALRRWRDNPTAHRQRLAHCKNGHARSLANSRERPGKGWACRTCERERQRLRKA